MESLNWFIRLASGCRRRSKYYEEKRNGYWRPAKRSARRAQSSRRVITAKAKSFQFAAFGHTLKLVRDPQQVGLRIRQDDGDLIVTFSCTTGCPSAESLREAILRFYRDIAQAFLPTARRGACRTLRLCV